MPLAKTGTIEDQERVQKSINELYKPYITGQKQFEELEIDRDAHLAYLTDGLDPLPAAFVSLDANMPWICYWIIHSMDLLDYRIPETLASRVMNTLALCQHPNGGFGGGKNQEPHLACTYAAISALAIIGTQDAFQLIHRQALKDYLLSMKRRDGSFSMQLGGEADCRGSYCALASASLCGLLDEVSAGASQFIAACQTYEGGLGGVPYSEAHAGYTYCGFAALTILGSQDSIGLEQLADFARRSQCKVSGGFRGRTNKLVDGCYSFWTGALFPLLRKAIPDLAPFYSTGLQKYLLICAQDLGGGFKDKPEKSVDYYHTCYCLAGLSVAQHEPGASILGCAGNRLAEIDPIYNIRPEKITAIREYFKPE